jgi:hypothetical protein
MMLIVSKDVSIQSLTKPPSLSSVIIRQFYHFMSVISNYGYLVNESNNSYYYMIYRRRKCLDLSIRDPLKALSFVRKNAVT